ncbi:MAG: DUF2922 domain-containing protein [Vagococcus sp.]
MKKLIMTFLNEEGNKTYLRPTVTHNELTAKQVKDVMDGIIELDVFEKEGDALYVETKSAKYTETTVTELF